jgi:NodT family efflux transporter outer membrane factor (OMF) lipoprotein
MSLKKENVAVSRDRMSVTGVSARQQDKNGTVLAPGGHAAHRRWTRRALPAAVWLAAAFVGGCAVGPDYKTPPAPVTEQWRAKTEQVIAGQPANPRDWWKSFNDPVLDALVDEAFAQNLDLQTVALRIVQGRLARSTALFMFGPAILANASAVHNNMSTGVKPEVTVKFPPGIPKPTHSPVSITPELDIFSGGFDAIWEMDLWGKLRRNLESTNAELTSDVAFYDDVLVTMVGEVAATYIQIRTVEQRLNAMRKIVQLDKDFLAITEERVRSGQAPETDALLAKVLLGATEAAIPRLEGTQRQLENALCILLGKPVQDIRSQLGGVGNIPATPGNIAVGIPADLLRRRPDVRMSESRAHSQCALIGKAKASALFPSLTLIGALGVQSSKTSTLFDSNSDYSTYGATSNWGILLYPATVQGIRIQDAMFEQAILQYKQTVLRAGMEVENAIDAAETAKREVTILGDNVAVAQKTAEMTVGAYKQGTVIVSVPLAALTLLASQQDQLIDQQGASALSVVSIYKGIGGGWELREGRELIPQEMQERMKDRSDWGFLWGGRFLRTANLPMPPSEEPLIIRP